MRFRRLISAASIAALLSLGSATAASRPSNATAQCADGTYSAAKTKQGACSQHGGVKTWFGDQAVAVPRPAPRATAIPKNATAQCNDGTYSSAKTKQGACSQHGGVRIWYADQTAASLPPATRPAPTTTPAPPPPRGGMASSTVTPNPQNATARCKDGTLSFAANHRGACSHHGGVAQWFR